MPQERSSDTAIKPTKAVYLLQELKEVSKSGSDDIHLLPDESNIHKWKAFIKVNNSCQLSCELGC